MSESGCLHNNKFESIKVEGDIDGKNVIINGNHKHTSTDRDLNTDVSNYTVRTMISCGTENGKYLNRSHKISCDLSKEYQKSVLPLSSIEITEIANADDNNDNHNDRIVDFAVEGTKYNVGSIHTDAVASKVSNYVANEITERNQMTDQILNLAGDLYDHLHKTIYNNCFMSIDNPHLLHALKDPNTGSIQLKKSYEYKTALSSPGDQLSLQNTWNINPRIEPLTGDQIIEEKIPLFSSMFKYYIKWPPNTMLHDLIIIPSEEIEFKTSADTYTAVSGDADARTKILHQNSVQRFRRELCINLIKVGNQEKIHNGISSSMETGVAGRYTPGSGSMNAAAKEEMYRNINTQNFNSDFEVDYDSIVFSGSPSVTVEKVRRVPSYDRLGSIAYRQKYEIGKSHIGTFKKYGNNGNYLIREFPIMAAPDANEGEGDSTTVWGKHTPIYAVRNGQPPEIRVVSSGGSIEKHHQHQTSRETNKLKHGTIDINPEFSMKKFGTDGEMNSHSTCLRCGKTNDGVPIPSTDFSYSFAKRRNGVQATIGANANDLTTRMNTLNRISTSTFDYDKTTSDRSELSGEHPPSRKIPMKDGGECSFYNDTSEPVYLELNIGQNSHHIGGPEVTNTGFNSLGGPPDDILLSGGEPFEGDTRINHSHTIITNTMRSAGMSVGSTGITETRHTPDGGTLVKDGDTHSDNPQDNGDSINLRFKAIFIFKSIPNE